ncbi:hypothetical protein FACS1894181_09460 [Bacteroidia bacterium]|nr:hypothetical protein FACS1894181_09460 [Bacteroidia bacterium]
MKKFGFIFLKCAGALALCLLLSGCSTDDPDNPDSAVPDPAGTVLVSVRNASNGSTFVNFDGGGFSIGADDNFTGGSQFVTIGAMKGIGNITKIPASGWANKVAVVPGYGYVGRYNLYNVMPYNYVRVSYFRLYVVDYIESTSGGVIGADVKYLSPSHVKPDASAITVSKQNVNLDADPTNLVGENITVSPYLINWSASSSADWCCVFRADWDKFRIWADRNDTNTPRTATVTVKIEGLPDKTIQVTQAAWR